MANTRFCHWWVRHFRQLAYTHFRIIQSELCCLPQLVRKLIQSHSGAKSYMVLTDETVARIRTEMLAADAKNIVFAMKQMGLSRAEALSLIETYWEVEE